MLLCFCIWHLVLEACMLLHTVPAGSMSKRTPVMYGLQVLISRRSFMTSTAVVKGRKKVAVPPIVKAFTDIVYKTCLDGGFRVLL